MKNIVKLFVVIVLATFYSSCSKEEYVSKEVVVVNPTLKLNGVEVVVLQSGQSYVDEGATVYPGYDESGTIIIDTAGKGIKIYSDEATDVNGVKTVKVGTAEGISFVNYTYTNHYGFETTKQRLVVVVNQAYTSNISGNYKRATTGAILKVTNLGNGVHALKDPGGVGSSPYNSDVLYIIVKNDNSVICPVQTLAGTNATISKLSSVSITSTQIKYALTASSAYGASVRTFDKQ